jgi:hypothetical protein
MDEEEGFRVRSRTRRTNTGRSLKAVETPYLKGAEYWRNTGADDGT